MPSTGPAPCSSRSPRSSRGGGNLISLSGNTCYRQVRLESSGRKLTFYKYAGADPAKHALDVSVALAEPPVNRSQAALLGASFTYGAWGAQVAHPYRLRFPGHWAMAGVTATQTAPFLGYETDAAPYVEEDEGYPRTTGEEGTPPTIVLLGTADLRDAELAEARRGDDEHLSPERDRVQRRFD